MSDELKLENLYIRTDMPFELLKAATDQCVVYDNESCIFHLHAVASDGDDVEISIVCQFLTDPTRGESSISVSMDGKSRTVTANLYNWSNDFYTISNRLKIFSYCGNAVYIEFIVRSIACIDNNNYAECKKRHVTINAYTQSVEMATMMKQYEDQKKAAAILKAQQDKTAEEMEKLKENQANGFGLGALAGMMGGMNNMMNMNGIPQDIIDAEAKEVERIEEEATTTETAPTEENTSEIPPDEDGTQYREL